MSENINQEKGTLSINTENLLPIIKKWLYSDKEIFLREMVSNAVDAMTKMKHLSLVGEYQGELGNLELNIKADKDNKTLTFSDSGIGMTADEVKKYINQIAFSGAAEFMEKYKDNNEDNGIIGHFGLGFYSAFMVSDVVEIITKSYKDEPAVHWSNDGSAEYTLEPADKSSRGTDIILHISDDNKDFLEESKITELITKYCNFLPFPIKLGDKEINDQHPLWLKAAKDIKDEDYKEFYQKLFPMDLEPLFWIHLDVEVPFRLKGILYFPRFRNEFDTKGRIKLFCNQVFVSDNAKEIIPEFLTLLQGCLDIPDLPLNVSRSYLQNDPIVRKISEHITKKVSDKLNSLFKKDRENYEKYWEDINLFVKFGAINDEKFYDKIKDIIIFKSTDGCYKTLNDYLEKNKGVNKETNGKQTVFYATNEEEQITYINALKSHGMESLILKSTLVDINFLMFLERKLGNVTFTRVDSDIDQQLAEDGDKSDDKKDEKESDEDKALRELFEKNVEVEKESDKPMIKLQALKDENVTGMIVLSEYMRRFKDMSMGFMAGDDGDNGLGMHTLVVNKNNPKIKNLAELAKDEANADKVKQTINHIYDLALLTQNQLKGQRLAKFIERSNQMI